MSSSNLQLFTHHTQNTKENVFQDYKWYAQL